MKPVFQRALILAAASFVLHLLWERLHIGLYTGYGALEGMLPVYLYATLGDVFYTFVGVGIAVFLCGLRLWRRPQRRDFALLAAIGFSIATFVEYKAMLLGRWEYTDAMPLVYGFGLSPLLQMTILLPLSVYLVARFETWFNSGNG